jgi:hypothetical protein
MSSAAGFPDLEDFIFKLRWDLLRKEDWLERLKQHLELRNITFNKTMALKAVDENYSNAQNKEFVNGINLKYRERALKEFGIFSSANIPDSSDLWRNYVGQEFYGYCIGFNIHRLLGIGLGIGIAPVIYYKGDYPEIKPTNSDLSDLLLSLLIKKHELYSFEREIRLWCHQADHGIAFPDNAVTEIYFHPDLAKDSELMSHLKLKYKWARFYYIQSNDIGKPIKMNKIKFAE